MSQNSFTNTASLTATMMGGGAILMWAALALLTDLSGTMPPFQLAALTFGIGTLTLIAFDFLSGKRQQDWQRFDGRLVFLGAIGLFLYHALYFAALRHAPAIEASLIAYLWPLLIVVGTALLPGQRLRWFHLLGAFLGFVGTVLIITGGKGFAANPDHIFGYGLALVAAFTWAGYSLAARRFAHVPSSIVTFYCGGSAMMALIAHLFFETTSWPTSMTQWLAIIGLGVAPLGAAFYLWDHAMKHGHLAAIGAASYGAPLLSSLILVLAGRALMNWQIGLACVLITLGAIIAAKNIILQNGGNKP